MCGFWHKFSLKLLKTFTIEIGIVLMHGPEMRVVIAPLLELFPANTREFRFDAALEVQMTNEVSFLLVRAAALLARIASVRVHFVFAGSDLGQIEVSVET